MVRGIAPANSDYPGKRPQTVCVCVTLGIIGIPSDCFSFTVVFLVQQGAGVCFRCLQPTKTHLLHSDIVLGRQNYVPAFFKQNGTRLSPEPHLLQT